MARGVINTYLTIVSGQIRYILGTDNSGSHAIKYAYRDNLMAKYDYPLLDFPYFVNIFSGHNEDVYTYGFICGASLISYYWGLTAASCKSLNLNASYIICAGIIPDPIMRIPEYPGEYSRGDWRAISNWIIHPSYTADSLPINDIALLYLEVPFHLNKYIGLANLIPYSLLQGCDVAQKFRTCHVPVYENKTLDFNSKFVFLRVFLSEINNCQVYVNGIIIKPDFSHICSMTDIELNNRGCLGSLGSPLTCADKQVGVMLNVFECNKSSRALYTRVDLYQQWIQKYVSVGLRYTESRASYFCHRGEVVVQSVVKASKAMNPNVKNLCLFAVIIISCNY